jgi:sortase B
MSCIRTGGRNWRRPEKNVSRPENELNVKITVICIAVALAAALLAVCVFVLLPLVISDANRQVEENNLAQDLYEMTVEKDIPAPTPGAAAVFEPGTEQTPALRFPRDGFSAALQQNPDIIGRITIEACDIEYLVTQTTDNKTYLSVGYDRQKSKNGTIFMDYRCDADADPLCGHYIIYGHNMKSGAMFHNLMRFKDEDFFYANRIFRFDTLYEDYEWEIFSAYVSPATADYIKTSFADETEWLSFLQTEQQKSAFETGVTLSASDVVLTLSTCTYEFDDARLVIHARLVG